MDPESLEDRLSEYVERRERGEALTPEAFASEHPAAGAELLAALRALSTTEALFPSGAPDLPARVGPYRVIGEIGRGGMGRVLEVVDPAHPDRPIALKLLHVSLGGEARALERFRREGQALERLRHPSIVRVHAAGLLDERPYLAMEKVAGTSLAEHLRRARARAAQGVPATEALELPGQGTPHERAARLVARLASAMAAAHVAGVLHRDLNPRNVLVRPDGEPVVIDFGLVRASGAPTLTGSGDLLGTPQYMAPEQARGERVDERTDVFGLGAILREMLTLAPPRAAGDTLALVRRAGSRPLAPPARTLGLPRALVLVVRHATAFFPRWRYAACADLARDLELFLAGAPVRTRAPGVAERACEFLLVNRRAVLAAAALLAVLGTAVLVRPPRNDEELRQAWIQGMNAIVLPWLANDLAGAQAALARLRWEEPGAPFVDFLAALASDDLAHDSSEPATRALLEGERARRAGDARLALQRFRTAWDVAPGYPLVVLLQGLAALEAGEPAAARGALEASAAPFGAAPRLHAALARCYEELGLHADAARALQAWLALQPDQVEAWQALERVRTVLGDEPGAAAARERARALGQTEPR